MNGKSSADGAYEPLGVPTSFGEALRTFRASAELTQEELAARSGVSVRAISDLERGVKTRPQRATVRLLADGMELTETERSMLEATVPSRQRIRTQQVKSLDLPIGGFLGAVPENALIARANEVARVRGVVDSVRNCAGRLILLSGEPGVGKTRLAQEIALICRASGMYVAAGQCYQPQQSVAFYPFLTIVKRLRSVAWSLLHIDPLDRWPQLRALVPELPEDRVISDIPVSSDGDQQRLFWAVTGLIDLISRDMPVALALDDLHWADQSSVELLHHLARELRSAPVLLLGTYRDVDVGRRHPFRGVLRNLHREHLSEEISVKRLDQTETSALIHSMLDGGEVSADFANVVYTQTEGNAFFVQEVVRTLVERGDAYRQDGTWKYRNEEDVTVPRTVQEVIGERLARLSESTQSLLREASVLGTTFEFDDLEAMSGLSEIDLESSLEEASYSRLIRGGESDTYHFNHALVQRVLYRHLSPGRRRRLHRSAAEAIEQQPRRVREQRAAELAWHFMEAGDRARALPHTVMAADQAEERFAHREAVRLYRLALDSLDERDGIAVRALILEKLGWVLTNYGRYAEARQEVEHSRSLYRTVRDLAAEVRVTVQLGSVYRAMGSPDTAIDNVQALLDRLDPNVHPQEVAELNIVLETLCYTTGRFEEGLRAAEQAVHLSRTTGDFAALARAKTGRGSELVMLSRLLEGIDVLEQAIAVPGADKDPYNLSRALENLSQAHLLRGNMQRSLELTRRSLAVAERIQSPWDTAMALYSAGSALRLSGDWEGARIQLEQCDELRRSLAPSWWSIYGILEFAALCIDSGDLSRARALISEALNIAQQSGHLEGRRAVERLQSHMDIWQGRPEAAVNRLEPLLDRPGLVELQVTEFLPTLASAYEATGDHGRAEQTIEEAICRSRAVDAQLLLAEALVVRGRMRGAEQRWGEAERDLDEAVRLAVEMPYPYLEARALYEWGVMSQQRDDFEQARERLTAALAIFERLGAKPYVERTKQAMANL